MKKVDTGYDLVFKFDDAIDIETCDAIYDYMISSKEHLDQQDIKKMPWQEGDTTSYSSIKELAIKEKIKSYKSKINNIISECFKVETYPHFSDLVLWRTGRQMWWHKDNGYEWDKDVFKPRKFSCVCYLNDSFTGGETLIKQGEEIYTSTPKKGSLVCFTSDERCEHRVTEVTSGTRLTLAIWFATDIKYKEND
jgi:predicted 2-oxoglutarate/Fe(II)-dependent dioxygenase YbiX